MEITQRELAARLEGFRLTVRSDSGPANGAVDDPQAVAQVLFSELAAAQARDGVLDAHIHCDCVPEDLELSVMAHILALMREPALDGHAVIRALYPLGGPALCRVLRWFTARFPAGPDIRPF
jgi:hypothetical protein